MSVVTWIGHIGELRPIRCTPPAIAAPVTRPSSRGVTIAGRAYTQQAPRSARTWTWSLGSATQDSIAELVALEAGVYGAPPYRMYDPYAAKINMLPPGAAVPGSLYDLAQLAADDDVSSFADDSPPMLWDGRPVAWSVAVTGTVVVPAVDGGADPVPVLPGRAYTFAAGGTKLTGAAWAVGLRWLDAGGSTAGEVLEPVGVADDPRRGVVTAVAPPEATSVLCVVDGGGQTVSHVSALQLTETDEPVAWQPGMGMPRVSIPAGYGQTLKRLALGECDPALFSVEIELVEVDG